MREAGKEEVEKMGRWGKSESGGKERSWEDEKVRR
jgi:hypothetical protein